ncbi:MAG: alpha/beta hydrolase [Rhizobiales bacterium]|nr:alpha/beta hydrolase [Hyphomicrobiales bacterium]NRB13278.1 alpha/beta hydrolase [Hyphomicrobiales bacterium]
MKTEIIEINGNSFFVRLWGDASKRPLLMLHGFPEHSGAWHQLAAGLTDEFFCIAPDQRGYGQSFKPNGVENYRISEVVGDIAGFISHYTDNGKIDLLGHDWGAAAAYGAAIAIPDMVDNLLILNGVHPAAFQNELAKGGAQTAASQYFHWLRTDASTHKLAQNNFAKLIEFMSNGMDCEWLQGEVLSDYLQQWQDEDVLDCMLNWYRASPIIIPKTGHTMEPDKLLKFNQTDMRINMPHLIIWGEKDKALTAETRDGIFDYCDDVKIELIADADHWLHHQQPGKIAKLIRAFLLA